MPAPPRTQPRSGPGNARRARRPAGARAVLEGSIEELAPGGEGVARVDVHGERRAVFVAGAAVGDRLRLDVDLSRRPARGAIVERLGDGPSRVTPPCTFAGTCGGCDWMQVRPDAQLAAHAAQVRDALGRTEVPMTTHLAESPLGYRSRARVHVRASGGRAIVGAHAAGSHEPVEVDTCVVLHPDLERARRVIAPLFEGAHGRGEVQLALGAFTEGPRLPVLEVRWDGAAGGALPPTVFARLERAVADGVVQGARVSAGATSRPAAIGDPTPWMLGADGAPLKLAPGGFGQASDAGNLLLARCIRRHATPGLRTLELYAGAGNFSVLLARTAATLAAVESSREACAAARDNLGARGLDARVSEGDADAHVVGSGTQLLVLDPPRTGAREVFARLAAGPRGALTSIVYVSCDPQTLGRDVALLAGRFEPRAVDVCQLFPQTSHVEVVVRLDRVRGGSA